MSSNAFSAAAILLSAGVVVPLFFFVLITQVTTIGLKETDEPDNRHYFKVGVEPARSSLLNQNRAAHKPRPGQSPQLHSLWIYPLKSCRGIELARSRVLPTGLEFDRLYTFAQLRETDASKDLSAPSWEFLTQRQLPLLANVEVELWLPTPHAAASRKKANGGADADDGIIIVRFPWRRPGWTGLVQWIVTKFSRGFGAQPQKKFTLPVNFPSDEAIKADGYEYGNVRIWKEHTMALNLAKDVPPELHTYLGMPPGRPLGLFRMDPSKQREVFRCAPSKETAGYQPVVDFHDAVSCLEDRICYNHADRMPVPSSSHEPQQSVGL